VDNSVDSAKQSVVRRLEYGFLMLATFNDNRLPPRFWAKVKVDDVSGCWKWTGSITSRGYGQIQWKTADGFRRVAVHRLSLLTIGAGIPDGLEVDHECETKVCVNPWHLKAVTSKRNIELHHERHPYLVCKNGHRIDEVGTYAAGQGWRRCAFCTKQAQERYREKKRKSKPRRARPAHCKRGHLRTPENMSGRNCRLCENLRNRTAYHRRRNHVSQP